MGVRCQLAALTTVDIAVEYQAARLDALEQHHAGGRGGRRGRRWRASSRWGRPAPSLRPRPATVSSRRMGSATRGTGWPSAKCCGLGGMVSGMASPSLNCGIARQGRQAAPSLAQRAVPPRLTRRRPYRLCIARKTHAGRDPASRHPGGPSGARHPDAGQARAGDGLSRTNDPLPGASPLPAQRKVPNWRSPSRGRHWRSGCGR